MSNSQDYLRCPSPKCLSLDVEPSIRHSQGKARAIATCRTCGTRGPAERFIASGRMFTHNRQVHLGFTSEQDPTQQRILDPSIKFAGSEGVPVEPQFVVSPENGVDLWPIRKIETPTGFVNETVVVNGLFCRQCKSIGEKPGWMLETPPDSSVIAVCFCPECTTYNFIAVDKKEHNEND